MIFYYYFFFFYIHILLNINIKNSVILITPQKNTSYLNMLTSLVRFVFLISTFLPFLLQ